MDKEVVKELIQFDMNKRKPQKRAYQNSGFALSREKLLETYIELESQLGGKGASEKVAKEITASMLA